MPLAIGQEKVRENRARRAAKRQGLYLSKSALKDPRAIGFGLWACSDRRPARPKYIYTLDEIEAILRGEAP